MPLTTIAFWITYVGGVCAALFNPLAGVVLYILVYHLNPETQWWGQSVRALGLRTSFTVALATGVGVLLRRPLLEHGARQFPLPFVLALLLGLVAMGSLAWGTEVTERGRYLAEKYVKLMIIVFILIRCVRRPLHYHCVLMAWLVGVAYLGYQASGGAGVLQAGRLTRGLGGPDFAESSGLAVHLTAALPLIGSMFFILRTWWGRAFVLVTGALTVNTIVATRTRSVLVGLAVMAVSGLLSLPRGYRLKGLGAAALGTLLSLQLVDPAWWNRMQSLSQYRSDASAAARLTIWKAGLAMARDHPFGIGLGNFHHRVMEYAPDLEITRSAHNTVVACLAELGWPGLALFVGIAGVSVWRLGRLRRVARQLPAHVEIRLHRWRTRFHLGWHAVGLRTALLGYLACAMFTTRLFTEDLWLLLAFGMCLQNISNYLLAHAEATEHRSKEPGAANREARTGPAPTAASLQPSAG